MRGRHVELKAVDVTSSLAADTTGALALMNGLVPGTGFSQRVGRQVQFVSLECNFLSKVTDGTGEDQYHRVLIVQDKQPNAGALTITDVLNSVSTASFPNLVNQKRFRILLDRRIYLNDDSEPGSGRVWAWSTPINIVTQYNDGNAGTVADIATNSLYFISIGSEAAGATAGTELCASRLRFVDA